MAAGVDRNADISIKRKEADVDVGHTRKRTKVYAEGVLLLGPDPPYKMKLFPIVTMSRPLQNIIASEDIGERNFTIEFSACPGDHSAFEIIESFSYGLTIAKDVLISHALDVLEVCDFFQLTTVSAKIWLIVGEHFRSGLEKELTEIRKKATKGRTKVRTGHHVWLLVEGYLRTKETTDFRLESHTVRLRDLVAVCNQVNSQECELEKATKASVSASEKFNPQAHELEKAKTHLGVLLYNIISYKRLQCVLETANKDLKTVRTMHNVKKNR